VPHMFAVLVVLALIFSATPGIAADPCAISEEHTSELQSHHDIVCRLLLEKKQTTETKP